MYPGSSKFRVYFTRQCVLTLSTISNSKMGLKCVRTYDTQKLLHYVSIIISETIYMVISRFIAASVELFPIIRYR